MIVFCISMFAAKTMSRYNGNITSLLILILFTTILLYWCIKNIDNNETLK